jgi:hypothetical protein
MGQIKPPQVIGVLELSRIIGVNVNSINQRGFVKVLLAAVREATLMIFIS